MKKVSLIFIMAFFTCGLFVGNSFAASGEPQYGGVLKRIINSFPKILGYPPQMGANDWYAADMTLEPLIAYAPDGSYEPVLVTAWESDPVKKTLTWTLRKGVKFHDGTDWNAEALKWNYEMQLASKRLSGGKFIDSLEVVDDYTLRMHLNYIDFMSIQNYGLSVRVISPTAFEKAGNGDVEKSKEWARSYPVGTGPFKYVEFKRDVLYKVEKFKDYWRKGRPYLDGIELRLIPDPMTASAMLMAKEADVWASNANIIPSALDLEKRGFGVNWGTGLGQCLFFNAEDPNLPFIKKEVREAIEYAIDKQALANMLGLGKYKPMKQLSQEGFLAYMPDYDPRPYNPEKAVKLLAEAGYPKGFETTILTNERDRDLAAAVQGYLKNVGILASLDVADMGRYYTIYPRGWKEMLLAFYGINPDNSDLFFHFGPSPVTFQKSIAKSPAYLKACKEALKAPDLQAAKPLMQKIIRQAGEDVMLIPLYTTSAVVVYQKYFHTKYLTPEGPYRWYLYDDWLEQ